jgi:hypothetical protein
LFLQIYPFDKESQTDNNRRVVRSEAGTDQQLYGSHTGTWLDGLDGVAALAGVLNPHRPPHPAESRCQAGE